MSANEKVFYAQEAVSSTDVVLLIKTPFNQDTMLGWVVH